MRPLAPLATPGFLGVEIVQVLSGADCDAVLASLDDRRWLDARVTDADAQEGAVRPDVRSVLSQRLPVRHDGFPLDVIVDAVAAANGRRWRYELSGFGEEDPPSVLRYEDAAQDHFRPHHDAGQFAPTRKLSFSLQLSDPADYRGGDLVIEGGDLGAGRRRGAMTIFSSAARHEVTPVYSGVRAAIVGWIHGPTFR